MTRSSSGEGIRAKHGAETDFRKDVHSVRTDVAAVSGRGAGDSYETHEALERDRRGRVIFPPSFPLGLTRKCQEPLLQNAGRKVHPNVLYVEVVASVIGDAADGSGLAHL